MVTKGTRILKLEMKGFKSFALKTEVTFGEKFNCILGPNGSGKSNVIDALAFVLGKSGAKGLRAEKSANLIYNGGKSKKPSKHGEVSIWFSNKPKVFPLETEDIKITRIIRESGNSVYKINDETRTRTQVLDLLSAARINPDGYNIVLQGDVIHFVEMPTTERRLIIEEIAGINIYEAKKQKALNELGKVDEKLNEADIILTERKVYLKELKKERDQALEFKELDDKIKRNKFTLLNKKIKERETSLSDLKKKVEGQDHDKAKHENNISEYEKKIDKLKVEIEAINKEVEDRGEKEQVAVHKEIEDSKVELALNKNRIDALNEEKRKLEQRKHDLEKNSSELTSKLKELERTQTDLKKRITQREEQIGQLDKKITAFREKHNLKDAQNIDEKINKIDERADVLQEEITKLREQQQHVLREKDKVDVHLTNLNARLDKLKNVAKEHKDALEKLKHKKGLFKQAALDLSQALTEDSSLASQLNNARDRLLAAKEKLSRERAKHASALERMGADRAISRIKELKNPQVHGLVSELGEVEEQYAQALETAAGGRMRSVVVETDQVAGQLISHLREHQLGVATFLPLNKLKAPLINQEFRQLKGEGVHGLAVDLISFAGKYASVFKYVFANTLVVEDIAVARRIGVGRVRMVTLKGDLIEASGAMTGGHVQRKSGLAFKHKDVSGSMDKIEAEVADIESVIHRLEEKKRDNEADIQRLRELKAGLEGEIIKEEKSLHLDDGDLGADSQKESDLIKESHQLDEAFDDVQRNITEKNSALAKLKIEKQQLRDQLASLRDPKYLAELNSFEEKKQELKDEIVELRIESKNKESEAANVFGPEAESTMKILKQLDKEHDDFEAEQKELHKLVKTQEKTLAQREETQKKFYAQFKELFAKRTKLTDQSNKHETDKARAQEKISSINAQQNALQLEHARLKAELAGLAEEARDYEGIEPYKGKDEGLIQQEINKFERMMGTIGAVNMKALEAYERVEAEYGNLQNKKQTLVVEREDVLLMINEIDAKKKELFMKTYKEMDKHFQRIFDTLFKKGTAHLELENEKDPFEGGVGVKVRLQGKRFLDIRSLSGGEKTMTALSFIFAVQEYQPASFYVLDEVDAALDKHNSETLANRVREYSDKAQYVMISHNDGVIGHADLLYGVSMNEHGMSKVTSLKI